MNWISMDVPAGWADLFVRTVKVAVVGFVVLQSKEWFDAGAFDTPAAAVDAALIAGGTFALNAILLRFVAPSLSSHSGSSRPPNTSRSQWE